MPRPVTRLLQSIKSLVDAQESPWLLPWHRGKTDRAIAVRAIRALALRLIRTQSGEKPIVYYVRALVWPLLLPVKAWRAAGGVSEPGFFLQFVRGCRDLLRYNLRPEAMRAIRDQHPDMQKLAALYLADRENQALLIHLNRTATSSPIGDKIHFDEFCASHRLPHIPIIARGLGGKFIAPASWPTISLFVKSANLWSGQGAEPLFYENKSASWRDQRGRRVTPETMGKWMLDTHADQAWLIQPMFKVDPLWSAWSPGPLGTVRIVTVIVSPGTAPEIVAASMRLPRTGMLVDNFSAGSLSAEIDWRTGKLGAALGHDPAHRWHDHHPDTGGLINGATVPDWPKLCALATAAHAAAPDLTAIGWDLTCHGEAPVLVEANPVFNLAPTVVLGETRWLEALLHRRKLL
jgi:hypothetical protein